MVASIGRVASAAASAKYFEGDDYYAKDSPEHQEASVWHGKGAEELGLLGTVDSQQFKAILEGHVGDTGKRLGRLRGGVFEHKPGTDITFSAPKSVSVAALVGGDKRILRAHDRAVTEAVKYIEKTLESRSVNPETGVLEKIRDQKMVAAAFRHEASRNLDPQLHSHVVIANMSQGADGKWRTIENRNFFDELKVYGAAYRNALAGELAKLGYEIEKTHSDGRFELKGMYSKEQLEAYSTRSADIKAAMAARGMAADPKLAAAVALMTRNKKDEPDRATLHKYWKDKGDDLGVGKVKTAGMDKNSVVPSKTTAGEAVRWAIRHLEERNSSFESKDLITSAINFAPGVHSIDAINKAIEKETEKGRLVVAEKVVGGGYTTDRTLAAEKENLDRMVAGQGGGRAFVSVEKVESRLENSQLRDGQKASVKLALTSQDRIVGIQGYAGSGKTTMLNEMREISESDSKIEFIGLAPSASAAQTLEKESGIKSNTLQSFLAKHTAISEGRVGSAILNKLQEEARNKAIVVDEASLASTKQVRDFFAITDKLGIERVVLVGDVKQLDAVEAGSPFRQLVNGGMGVAYMDEIMRQRDDNLKAAVINALEGKPREALQRLDKSIIETGKDEMGVRAAEQWLGLDSDGRDKTAIIAPTHNLREEINDTIRTNLTEEGIIRGDAISIDRFDSLRYTQAEREIAANYGTGDVVVFDRDVRGVDVEAGDVYRVIGHDGGNVLMVDDDGKQISLDPAGGVASRLDVFEERAMELKEGDQIRWTRNDKEHDLINNHQAEVRGFDENGVHLKGEDGREFSLDYDSRALHHCDYAFNSTVHSFQGRTVDNIIATLPSGHSDLTNQKVFYVEVSRARYEATFITDDKAELADKLEYNTGVGFTGRESIGVEDVSSKEVERHLTDTITDAWKEMGPSVTQAESDAHYAEYLKYGGEYVPDDIDTQDRREHDMVPDGHDSGLSKGESEQQKNMDIEREI